MTAATFLVPAPPHTKRRSAAAYACKARTLAPHPPTARVATAAGCQAQGLPPKRSKCALQGNPATQGLMPDCWRGTRASTRLDSTGDPGGGLSQA
eukprot:840421-Amphidinium_carterae.1